MGVEEGGWGGGAGLWRLDYGIVTAKLLPKSAMQ